MDRESIKKARYYKQQKCDVRDCFNYKSPGQFLCPGHNDLGIVNNKPTQMTEEAIRSIEDLECYINIFLKE